MEKLVGGLLRRRRLVIALFLVAALACAVMFLGVEVNYNLADYLPGDAESTLALELMEEEFDTALPNVRVMMPEVGITQALDIKAQLASVPGVTEVMWLDDVLDLRMPIEVADAELVETYYKEGAALFSVAVAEGAEREAVSAIYDIIGEEGAATGNAVNTAMMQQQAVRQVLNATAILLPIIVVLLLLTTSSWISPLLFLITIGVAVIINLGTNVFFPSISFMTQSVSPILQLAVSLDYAIFLLNSFERFRESCESAEEAMTLAVKQSFSAIAASALTTLFGFLALIFMRFGIGSDLGLNLVKGVVLSYISVVVFLPALALAFCKLLDKTRHKRLLPEFRSAGRVLMKLRVPALILVLLLVVPCFLAQSRADFLYGNGSPDTSMRYGADTERIDAAFGKSTSIVLLVPRGDTGKEAVLAARLDDIDGVTSVMSYATSVGNTIPDAFLGEAISSNFYSDNYARIVASAATDTEGEAAFSVVEQARALAREYYGGAALSCGESVNMYDMREVVQGDTAKVNLIAILFVFLTLLVTFRSLDLPLILLFVIESAIWINLSFPYFTGRPLVYLGYLVINTVQLGATIDYAILITDGYREKRRSLPARAALEGSLTENFVSVLTSALILSSAGLCLGLTSSMAVVAELGMLLARGTLLSLCMVLLVLPALLLLFDKLTARLTLRAGFFKEDV